MTGEHTTHPADDQRAAQRAAQRVPGWLAALDEPIVLDMLEALEALQALEDAVGAYDSIARFELLDAARRVVALWMDERSTARAGAGAGTDADADADADRVEANDVPGRRITLDIGGFELTDNEPAEVRRRGPPSHGGLTSPEDVVR